MDAVVQLIRNALCCVKDLNLFPLTILHDPNHTTKYYSFPSPHLSQTTPLELLISFTQLYACVSCTLSGFRLVKNNGLLKLQKLNRIADKIEDKYFKDIKSKKALAFIQQCMMKEANSAVRDTMVGTLVASIGVSFFWLFANSLHVTATGWIGGLPALIHALTVMEVALVPLLYLMLKDAAGSISKAAKIQAFLERFLGDDSKNKPAKGDDEWLDLETFTFLLGDDWKPIWSDCVVSSSSGQNVADDDKVLQKDMEGVETQIKLLTSKDNKTIVSEEVGQRLQNSAVKYKMEGYREYLYFILNFIAFYGYLLGIIVYYFEENEETKQQQPYFVTSLKFGTTNEIADWAGNFAGDLIWTIEPIVILLSPILIKRMIKLGETKIKSD